MEHPLITDVNDLTVDQLQERMDDLNKKLIMAHRMGKGDMVAQIQMAIESYKGKYQEKMNLKWGGRDQSDKIDIS